MYIYLHFNEYLNQAIYFCVQVDDRTIPQLQSKYKELKKNARQIFSNAKREIARTGNKTLRSSTVDALKDDGLLLLRKQMGPTATGFNSKHCK